MLGKDLYKIEVDVEITSEKLKSLVFFYEPLIGNDALYLYEYLVFRGNSVTFKELNDLLYFLNISVDRFEKTIEKLNKYRLVKTLNKGNTYIFVLANPLTRKEFIKNDIFVRDFILKTSGQHYQELISGFYELDKHPDYVDVSAKLDVKELENWSKEDETYLKAKPTNTYSFDTIFDIGYFLKDISSMLFPLKFRTEKNLKEIATLADLYNISYDQMRSIIQKSCKPNEDGFDLKILRYLCMNARTSYYEIDAGNYNVPCQNFLMNLQEGKEVTEYDKKILYKLSNEYHLRTSVINVLIEYCLNNSDNRLIENYIYPIASDFHRNNVNDYKTALERLGKPYNKKVVKAKTPTYDTSKNKDLSDEELERALNKLKK